MCVSNNMDDRDNCGNPYGVFYNLKVEKIIRPLEPDKKEPDKLLITNVILGESFELSVVGLSDDRELPKLLASEHVPVVRKERSNVQSYLITRYNELLEQNQIEYRHSQLGWFKCLDSDLFLLQHNELNGTVSECDRKNFKSQKGTKQAYFDLLDKYVFPCDNLSLAVAVGLSAVVVSRLREETGVDSLICNFSGQSTTGKTTAAKLIASLFAAPDKYGLVFKFNATSNALAARLSGINGLPMIIDDILVNEKLDISELIYSFADGGVKDRCSSNGEIKDDVRNTYSGTIVLTSEYPVLDCGNNNQGLIVRTLALNDIKWTPDAMTADLIQQTVAGNYGFIGGIFAEHIRNIPINTLYKQYLEAKKKLHQIMPNWGGFTDRLEKQYATIYLTVLLINKYFDKKLNADNLLKIALDSQQTSIEENDNASIALEAVKSYIIKYHNYFEFKPATEQLCKRGGEYFGTIVDKGQAKREVYILPDVVDKIISQNNIRDKRGVKREWRENGLIKTEKNRFTCKFSGSPIKNKRYTCFIFDDISIPFEVRKPTDTSECIDNTKWDNDEDAESIFGNIQ